MPFELGLDIGCRIFGNERQSNKRCLILEAERFRYQAALSDLSNSDIAVHNNEPIKALTEVRNWLCMAAKIKTPGPSTVWGRFNDFMADNYDALKARGFSDQDIQDLPVGELLPCIREWTNSNPTLGSRAKRVGGSTGKTSKTSPRTTMSAISTRKRSQRRG